MEPMLHMYHMYQRTNILIISKHIQYCIMAQVFAFYIIKSNPCFCIIHLLNVSLTRCLQIIIQRALISEDRLKKTRLGMCTWRSILFRASDNVIYKFRLSHEKRFIKQWLDLKWKNNDFNVWSYFDSWNTLCDSNTGSINLSCSSYAR